MGVAAETWQSVALMGATLLTGLTAGLYFAFSVAVMPGLRHCDDQAFVGVMRSINQRIQNGWFALAFAGSPLLTLLAGALHLAGGNARILAWEGTAFLLYGVTLVLTFRINIPLNEALDEADDSAPAAARERFKAAWVRSNHARTLLSTAALACLAWALALHGQ